MFRQEEKGEDRAIDRLLKAQAGLSGKPGRSGKSGKPVRSSANRSSGDGFGETGCTGFDPDLANAYVERLLGSLEVRRYEEHLSQCTACRSTIARMALADNKTIYGPPQVSTVDGRPGRAGLLTRTGPSVGSGWSGRLISIFFRPQWIVAMAAVLVLLISIPVLFTRHSATSRPDLVASTATSSGFADSVGKKSPVTGAPSEAQSVAGYNGATAASKAQASSPGGSRDEVRRESDSPVANPEPKDAEQKPSQSQPAAPTVADTLTAGRARNEVTPPAVPPAAGPARSEAPSNAPAGSGGNLSKEKTEQQRAGTREARDRSSQAQSGEDLETNQSQAQTKAPQSQRIDSAEAMQVPQDQGARQQSGQAVVLKKGVPGGDDKQVDEKLATVKPQDSVAPQPKSTSADDGAADTRRVIARAHSAGAKPDSRGVGSEALVTPQASSKKNDRSPLEKKVEGKKFRLIAGVWTDRQYSPYKEMAAVTVLRGSDVFNRLVAKEPALKLFFAGFGQQDRVVIVYKKIAYHLVPQPASNGTH